ncbi:hypothetical protein Lal_00045627 [Lupinus albus]|nr:hypothetical protein Lal_00045627 [Lupinus albus]
MIEFDGKINLDVNHITQVSLIKWRSILGVICDKRKITIKCQQDNRLHIPSHRILSWVNLHTRQCKIRDECIKEKVGVYYIKYGRIVSYIVWTCVEEAIRRLYKKSKSNKN